MVGGDPGEDSRHGHDAQGVPRSVGLSVNSAREPRSIGMPITAPMTVTVKAAPVANRANPAASPNQSVRGKQSLSDILITSTQVNSLVPRCRPEVSTDRQLVLTGWSDADWMWAPVGRPICATAVFSRLLVSVTP